MKFVSIQLLIGKSVSPVVNPRRMFTVIILVVETPCFVEPAHQCPGFLLSSISFYKLLILLFWHYNVYVTVPMYLLIITFSQTAVS